MEAIFDDDDLLDEDVFEGDEDEGMYLHTPHSLNNHTLYRSPALYLFF